MNRSWFVQHNGKAVGPLTSSQLKKLATASKIDSQTLVRLGEGGDWNRAETIQNLLPSNSIALASTASEGTTSAAGNLMLCPDCNSSVSKKAASCPHCGAPLSVVETDLFGDPGLPPSNAFQSLPPVAVYASPPQTSNSQTQKLASKTRWIPVVALSAVVVVLGGVLMAVLVQPQTNPPAERDPSDFSSSTTSSTSPDRKSFGELYATGQEALEDGENDVAVAAFTKAIELDPASASAVNARGVAYLRMRRLGSALSDFDTAIKLSPNQAKFYNNRAFVYSDKDEFQRAFSDMDRALSIDPANEEYKSHYRSIKAFSEPSETSSATSRIETKAKMANAESAPSRPVEANHAAKENVSQASRTKQDATREVERRIDAIMSTEKRSGMLLMDQFSIIHPSLLSAAIDEIEVTRIVPVNRNGNLAFKIFLEISFHSSIFGDPGSGKFIGGLEFKRGQWVKFNASN